MDLSVLERRLLKCIRSYGITHPNLSEDEMASELLSAVLPAPDDEGEHPAWWRLVNEFEICLNCHYSECHCSYGCGEPDADIIGKHGSWCAL